MQENTTKNGWTIFGEYVEKRPEIIVLLTLDVALLLLADLFQFVLGLLALAFSTWIVLPWAFYNELKNKKQWKPIRWLRRAEVSLFLAGVFFGLYVTIDVASELGTLDTFVLPLLALMKVSLLGFGFGLLSAGLYDTFKVINYYIGYKESGQNLLSMGSMPFLVFNLIIMLVQVLAIGYTWYLTRKITLTGMFYGVSIGVAFMGTILALQWSIHIGSLMKGLNFKGVMALFFVILPYILLIVLYLTTILGVSLF